MTQKRPKILMAYGFGIDVNRKQQFDSNPLMLTHYGVHPWALTPPAYENGLLEDSVTTSQGTTHSVGGAVWDIAWPADVSAYDALVFPDGGFAADSASAAQVAAQIESFVTAGKSIYAYGNGVMMLALAGIADMIDPTHATRLEVATFDELAGDLAGHYIDVVEADHYTWMPPESPERAAASLRVVTSKVDNAALGLLVSQLVSAPVMR